MLATGLLLAAAPAPARDVPFLAARVNDLADMVPRATRERLEARLGDLEARTGAQVAVLTVDSLEGEPVEDYAVRVFQTWKLGRRDVDDGVLLLVAEQERRMRIEVGYGLEARLTDAVSRHVLDDLVRPHFRRGDFGAGIEAGVDAIVAAVEGAPLPAAPAARPGGPAGSVVGLLLVGAVLLVTLGTFSLVALLAPGVVGWLLYLFLVPFYAAFPSILFPPYGGAVAAGTWLVLFPVLRALLNTPRGRKLRKRRGSLFAPAAGSSGGGRWHGGGSSGGGGFSGGGGRSGGGGASSSW